MEPITLLVAFGVTGGVVVSLLIFVLTKRPSAETPNGPRVPELLTPDAINMAHIRVTGVGGLGLMAVVVAVGLYFPELRWAMAAGIGLGAVMAVAMIVRSRRTGPMPSAGLAFGANTMLGIADAASEDAKRMSSI